MKNKSCLILCFVLLFQLAACGSENPVETVTTVAENETTTVAADDDYIPDDLPETDLGGYEFRILGFGDTRFAAVWVEDQNGSLVNDAVYNKLKAVEDRFNCKIVLAEGSTVGSNPSTSLEKETIQKTVLAGEDSFDIASAHDISLANLSLEGLFVNLYDIPNLDFDKPWWPKYTVDSLTFDNQMYMFSNTLSYNNLSDTRVMFFNKTLLTEMSVEMPYTSVYDGTWTLDKLNSITKLGFKDLNGDGKTDISDRFGIVNPNNYYCMLEPFNIEPYREIENGKLTYVFDLDKYQTIVEKLYSLLIGEGGFIAPNGDDAKKVFAEGRAIFAYGQLGNAVNNYSQTNVVYGILPMPKLSEMQTEYFSGCTDRPIVVPITALAHLKETGLIIEALSAEGYRKVFPAYFEQALKVRYADQTDDAKMIDIVNQNVILSFTYIYGNFASPYNKMLETMFNSSTPNTDVASYAASIKTVQEARVQDIMKAYQSMKNR